MWVRQLCRESFAWRFSDESKFFQFWIQKYKEAKASSLVRRKLTGKAQAYGEEGRTYQRKIYAKFAGKRREYARLKRAWARLDPVAVEKYRKYTREKQRARIKTDTHFMIRKKLGTRINMALKHYQKAAGTVALLGCSLAECRKHLEKLWKPGMSWSNCGRGGWHIDHIKPCVSFDLRDPEQQRACFHFSNLQPLWQWENLSKGPR